jgi:hypothetical protein
MASLVVRIPLAATVALVRQGAGGQEWALVGFGFLFVVLLAMGFLVCQMARLLKGKATSRRAIQ